MKKIKMNGAEFLVSYVLPLYETGAGAETIQNPADVQGPFIGYFCGRKKSALRFSPFPVLAPY
jgi:hypothetical protein